MKRSITATLVLVLIGCASLAFAQANPPSQAQLDEIAKAGSFAGKIVKARFLHGLGWISHTDMGIAVAADDGRDMFLYLRASSIISDANGRYLSFSDLPHLVSKNVEIRHAVITDATGRMEKVENGKAGVLLLHFRDWTAGSK